MSILKGYPSKVKQSVSDIFNDILITASPVRKLQHALDVISHIFVREVGTDACEADTTNAIIKATAHSANVGDVIRFTSGTQSGHEVKVVKVAANFIYLAEELDTTPAAADTFQILRHKFPIVNADGSLPITATAVVDTRLKFMKDAAQVFVTEDTITPANNIPLPVKITSATGDINITAGDLNVGIHKDNDSVKTFNGEDVKFVYRNDYGSTPVTTAAYVQINASTASAVTRMQIFDSSGQTLEIALGAVAAEVTKLYIIPGGNGDINVQIPAGTRVSVKAVSANATTGELTINFIG